MEGRVQRYGIKTVFLENYWTTATAPQEPTLKISCEQRRLGC